ncbi:MAG: hypothetical protein FJ102_26590 [Deltaproteobacteria bacterium]|nr:hypothetical protein [Deltaproteobacteria bacterium]
MIALLALFACTPDDKDTADTADTGAGDTAGDTDTDTDTDTAIDTDTDSGQDSLDFVDGPTGYQLDFTYTGDVSSGDVIRCGSFTGADLSGMPAEFQDFEATLPTSGLVEIDPGTWYAGCYLDLGGDDAAGPGEEDIGTYYGPHDGAPYPIEVYEGKTTIGAYIDFDSATPPAE